jgi:Protein of unknown function (DUF551)
MTWQPIATAPRDGTAFLAWESEEDEVVIAVAEREPANYPFFNATNYECYSEGRLTHWQQLPGPPNDD